MSNDDEFIRAAQEAIETHRDTFQKLRIAELEEQLADLQLAKSHLWADNQFLEAQCAALREVLSSAAYYYEPATMALAQSDAGAALLKRLQAAEAVCEALRDYEAVAGSSADYVLIYGARFERLLPALSAWIKAKEERK